MLQKTTGDLRLLVANSLWKVKGQKTDTLPVLIDAAAAARDIDIVGSSLLQRQPDELAATLDFRAK